ncbi:MAG: hypothetical protein RIQ60_4400 [Pseudomonadota bacterium]|jgi:uncharacterized protein (TIGR00369 family)
MDFPIHIPFVEDLGLKLVRFADGEAEIWLDVNERLTNSFHVVHGGVSMTLMDVVMAHAARSVNLHLPDKGPGLVTIEMKTSFMRPGEGRLRAVGKLLHRTSTMAFTEASIFNEADALVAHATGTFKYVRKLPTEGRQLRDLRRLDGAGSD